MDCAPHDRTVRGRPRGGVDDERSCLEPAAPSSPPASSSLIPRSVSTQLKRDPSSEPSRTPALARTYLRRGVGLHSSKWWRSSASQRANVGALPSHRALEDGPSELVEARETDSWHVGSDPLARPAGDALDHADRECIPILFLASQVSSRPPGRALAPKANYSAGAPFSGVVSYSVVAREAEGRCENRWPLRPARPSQSSALSAPVDEVGGHDDDRGDEGGDDNGCEREAVERRRDQVGQTARIDRPQRTPENRPSLDVDTRIGAAPDGPSTESSRRHRPSPVQRQKLIRLDHATPCTPRHLGVTREER